MKFSLQKYFGVRLVSFVTICSFSFATGCATTQNYPSASTDPTAMEGTSGTYIATNSPQENLISPGFQFRLGNIEDRSLNGGFRVGFDGKILLPYNVSIKAAGLTLEQFQEQVATAYHPYFKGNSKVRADLIERAYWVDIRGLATKPGRYLLKQDTSIDEVIAKCGGFTKEAPAKFMRISSPAGNHSIDLDRYYRSGEPSKLPAWIGGEQIFFQSEEGSEELGSGAPEKNSIKLLGEVKRPGDISYRAGADFMYYLTEAGGPTRDMDPNKIQIFHPEGKGLVQEFSMDKKTSFPKISKGDTLIVFADRPSVLERFIQSGAGVASIISALALIILAGQRR